MDRNREGAACWRGRAILHAMAMSWHDFSAALDGAPLPSVVIDLDALERNVDRLRDRVAGSGKTLRVASKSVRHTGLLRRILERGGDRFAGVMCFTPREAAWLASEGFDDLLVAYPSLRGIDEVAAQVLEGKTIRLMADCEAHLRGYAEVAEAHGVQLEVLLELDVAYQSLGGRVHLGVLRSPLRSAEAVEALARRSRSIDGVRVVGLMGYEAQVAGLPDATPFSRALNPVRRAIKRLSVPQVAQIRAAAVEGLRRAGVEATVVNGGGTGSVNTTKREDAVTEVTAGSGFLCSHLFDYYRDSPFEPAAFFALEVVREPEPGIVTCLGGGYIASGEPGWDRAPVVHLPEGLEYVPMEGAGEVQTPLTVPPGVSIGIGDLVVFRHAKAGELAERFDVYRMVRGREVVAVEPTYRGEGACFG